MLILLSGSSRQNRVNESGRRSTSVWQSGCRATLGG